MYARRPPGPMSGRTLPAHAAAALPVIQPILHLIILHHIIPIPNKPQSQNVVSLERNQCHFFCSDQNCESTFQDKPQNSKWMVVAL